MSADKSALASSRVHTLPERSQVPSTKSKAKPRPKAPLRGKRLRLVELLLEIGDVLPWRLITLRSTAKPETAHLIEGPCRGLTVAEGDFTADESTRNGDLIGGKDDVADR